MRKPFVFFFSTIMICQLIGMNKTPPRQYLHPNVRIVHENRSIRIIFKSESAYFEYINKSKLSAATLIVGAGRGVHFDYPDIGRYSAAVYGDKEYNYLLVDNNYGDYYECDNLPDIKCSVEELLTKLKGTNCYNYIIFEYLPLDYGQPVPGSLDRIIYSALELLAPGGELIINAPSNESANELFLKPRISDKTRALINKISIKKITPSSEHPNEWPRYFPDAPCENEPFLAYIVQKK